MDKADIPKANALYQQWQMLTQAQRLMQQQGNLRIMSFSLVSESGIPVGVPAEGMTYPPEMLTAIKNMVDEQVKKVADELASMGFQAG